MTGVVVGCDIKQEWLLPWWWRHYRSHNAYPVAFVDFGMSEEGRAWCQEKGRLIELPLHQISSKDEIPDSVQEAWVGRYGPGIWNVRSAWLKKPFALLHSSFEYGLWLDLDCQVKKDFEPIFNGFRMGFEIAVVKDREQNSDFMLPGEISYNSGVIAFRNGPFLQQWVDTSMLWADRLPGDQEMLSRAIFLHRPALLELPAIFNWYFPWGSNEDAVVYHFCGGLGKTAILSSLQPTDFAPSLPHPTELSVKKHE